MLERRVRLAVGLALVLIVTFALAGAVATAAAVSDELSDGDGCETGGAAIDETTASPENVTKLAGNVTGCIADGGDASGAAAPPALTG